MGHSGSGGRGKPGNEAGGCPQTGTERRVSPCEHRGVGPTPEDDFEPLFRADHLPERRAPTEAAAPTRRAGGD